MEEEIKSGEQFQAEQAEALNKASDERVDSCGNSPDKENGNISFGKFKSAEALLNAYTNLQAEFTKKCQKLSDLEKEKTLEQSSEVKNARLEEFLSANQDANSCREEFSSFAMNERNQGGSIDGLWAKFVLSKLEAHDNVYEENPIVKKYIFEDENVRNKIIENYIKELNSTKPPALMSCQSGQTIAKVSSPTPSSLNEAKVLVEEMFS